MPNFVKKTIYEKAVFGAKYAVHFQRYEDSSPPDKLTKFSGPYDIAKWILWFKQEHPQKPDGLDINLFAILSAAMQMAENCE